MLTGLPLNNEWQARVMGRIFSMARWNPYVTNWPVVLGALRQLWEAGKISELKSPYYEPVNNEAKI